MLRILLLCALLPFTSVFCTDELRPEDPEILTRVFDAAPEDVGTVAEQVLQLFPDGTAMVRIVEVGEDTVVQSTHATLPDIQAIENALVDPGVGQHFAGETTTALPTDPAAEATAATPKFLPKTAWRLRMLAHRVVANGTIAGALVLLKGIVHDDFDPIRMATNFAVHGGVNGFFQWFGPVVANISYAPWNKAHFFPNFKMSLKEMVARTLFASWPKRVLFTMGSVLIYRLTDYVFTGNFDYPLATVVGIFQNIAAALAPAALGLEMAGRMGPPEAEGLPARNNKVFDRQNFVISVLFAAGLAINSPEMNDAFGIHGLWTPLYSTVAVGGFLWWATYSRWTNPELKPPVQFAVDTVKSCGASLVRGLKTIVGR